jgi:glycosyltransferase involved in cell wall biosynthesis
MDYNLNLAVVSDGARGQPSPEWLPGALAHGDSIDLIRSQRLQIESPQAPGGLESWLDKHSGDPECDERSARRLRDCLLPSLRWPGGGTSAISLPAPGRLRQRWERQRPDVIHVLGEGALAWSAVTVARQMQIPALVEVADVSCRQGEGAHARFGTGLKRRYQRYLHASASTLLVRTVCDRDALWVRGVRRVELIERPLDTRVFNTTGRGGLLRSRWGVSPTTLVASYVGPLKAGGCIDQVIRSFNALRVWHPDARFVLMGDGPLRAELAECYPDWIFVEPRTGIALAGHYSACDLLLLPEVGAARETAAAEALACGLPVVAWQTPALSTLLKSALTGRLVPAGSSDAFVAAARELAAGLRSNGQREDVRSRCAASVAHLSAAASFARINELHHRMVVQLPYESPCAMTPAPMVSG